MLPLAGRTYKAIFDFPGPLSSFSNKIVMAYGLGIVPKHIYVELEKIRKIRNAFSHSVKLTTLESESVASIFATMKKPPTTKTTLGEIFMDCVREIDEFLEKYVADKGGKIP
jgi:DNA-binding MltR family transcriptional regulator